MQTEYQPAAFKRGLTDIFVIFFESEVEYDSTKARSYRSPFPVIPAKAGIQNKLGAGFSIESRMTLGKFSPSPEGEGSNNKEF